MAWEHNGTSSLIFNLFGFFHGERETYCGKRAKVRSTTMFKLRRLFDSSKGSK